MAESKKVTEIEITQGRDGVWNYQGRDAGGRKVTAAVSESGYGNRSLAKQAAHKRYPTARIR